MPPVPPPPQAASAAAELHAQVRELLALAPELALQRASGFRDSVLRMRMRREAYLALAERDAEAAARLLPQVAGDPWLGRLPFARALDIGWYSAGPAPAETRALLLAAAKRHPEMALRSAGQYIELPYGREVREVARQALPPTPPEKRILEIGQNASEAAAVSWPEAIALAGSAITERERLTVTVLLRRSVWPMEAAAEPSKSLRAALALIASDGRMGNVPEAVYTASLRGIDQDEDPVEAGALAAAYLEFVPRNVVQYLPVTGITGVLRRVALASPAESLATERLFPGKVCVQRHLFPNDDDGVESYDSFLAAYASAGRWKVAHSSGVTHISGNGPDGRRLEILANRPIDLHSPANRGREAESAGRQREVEEFLQARDWKPLVLVHRGHDHHFPRTRQELRPGMRLVFLGSCRGMQSVEDVVTRSPEAQVIATRAIGTTAINDRLLVALNQRLLDERGPLDWDAFWRESAAGAGAERFADYVPPHRNGVARFLSAWFREALAAP